MFVMNNSTVTAFNVTSAGTKSVTSPVYNHTEDDCYFKAIVGLVIAVVVLVLLLVLVIILRYMYQHKGSYHTNEAKGTEFAETADAALRRDPAVQDAMDESKKEYFI